MTCLLWFFSTLIFSPTILQNYHEFSRFFFVSNCIVSDTSMTWELRTSNSSPTQNISEGAHDVFILMDSCNYLYSFQKLVAASFFVNINCYFLIREDLVITPAYLLKLRFILCSFLCKSIYCLSLLSFYGLRI